jgi:hypothetical protein
MAKLRSLRIKDKSYIFKAFGNDKEESPAKVVFSRFPTTGESFIAVERKNLFEGIDVGKIGEREMQSIIADKIVDSFVHNLRAGNVDYPRFLSECVERIENLEYDRFKITSPEDFFKLLPHDATYMIAEELYSYANERDEFTMGESET